MTQITLSDELARQISEASAPIVLVDSRGHKLGQIAPMSAEQAEHLSDDELAEIKRRMQSPGEYLTLQQMKSQLGWQDQR
jgi:hypothetical protein